MYTSSLACPYNCAYCTNVGVYGRKWNALEPDQVVEETSDLVERYGLSLLWIVDDNFLVDRERAIGIAEGLVRRGVKFDWERSILDQSGESIHGGGTQAAPARGAFSGGAGRRHGPRPKSCI